MIQAVTGILFVIPAILIFDSFRARSISRTLTPLIATLVHAFLLSFITVISLVIWTWSGTAFYFTYLAYSVGATLLVTAVTYAITWALNRSRKKQIAPRLRLLLYQLLLSNAIVLTFMYAIPFMQSHQSARNERERTKLAQLGSMLRVADVRADDEHVIVTFSTGALNNAGYMLHATSTISADAFAKPGATCSYEQDVTFTKEDQTVSLSIPHDFIRNCLDREKIIQQNASLNGLNMTVFPRIRRGIVDTSLSPVSIPSWIDIRVTGRDIGMTDKSGRITRVGW